MKRAIHIRHLLTVLLLASGTSVVAVEADTFSPVVSFQYLDSLADAPATSPITSPVVSYQYFDWIGDANASFQSSPNVSFFFSGGVTLSFSGIVRTTAGVPVAGAAITLKRYGTAFWTGTSAANGTFSASNVQAANFIITVTKPGFTTLVTNYGGEAGGNQAFDLWLTPTPAEPATQATERTPTIAEKARPTDTPATTSRLLRYDSSAEQFVNSLTGLSANLPTVVLTHGWLSDPNVWALDVAKKITAQAGTPPNIVAWDWHTKASFAQMKLPSSDVAWTEGALLGQALQNSPLGTAYIEHLHFMGHSLGALVNCAACEYLHHGFAHESANSPTPWDKNHTEPHVTLFDEAEIVSVYGNNVLASPSLSAALATIRSGLGQTSTAPQNGWRYPVPKTAKWSDNYISAVGIQRQDAVNVCLLKPALFYNRLNVVGAHAYAYEWYRDAMTPTGTLPVISYALSKEAGAVFPPTGSGKTVGSLWLENLATLDAYDQTPSPTPTNYDCNLLILSAFAMPTQVRATTQEALLAVQVGDATGKLIMSSYATGLNLVGEVGGNVIYKSGQVLTSAKTKVGQLWDAAADTASDLLNTISPDSQLVGPLTAPTFSIHLTSQAAAPQGRQLRGLAAVAAASDPSPSAWMSVKVPANAAMMVFDFTVTGDPAEDSVACAVNGTNVFSLPAKYVPADSPVSTDMLDVSAYAGQTVELFFGLVGGTSTNCTLAIDGIRFITVPDPTVGIADMGATFGVKWPAAATGWILECSETLAPDSWQIVPTDTGLSFADGVATLAVTKTGVRKFYRLRRLP